MQAGRRVGVGVPPGSPVGGAAQKAGAVARPIAFPAWLPYGAWFDVSFVNVLGAGVH